MLHRVALRWLRFPSSSAAWLRAEPPRSLSTHVQRPSLRSNSSSISPALRVGVSSLEALAQALHGRPCVNISFDSMPRRPGCGLQHLGRSRDALESSIAPLVEIAEVPRHRGELSDVLTDEAERPGSAISQGFEQGDRQPAGASPPPRPRRSRTRPASNGECSAVSPPYGRNRPAPWCSVP